MDILSKIFEPLVAGKTVDYPARMKRGQNLLSAVTAVGAVVVLFVPGLEPYLNADTLLKVFTAYSAVNLYFTTASTEKVGL